MKFSRRCISVAVLTTAVVSASCANSSDSWKPDYCARTDPDLQSADLPRRFGMILYQAFEPVDVYGTLEPLYALSRSTKLELHLLSQSLDPVTVAPVSPEMNPFNSSFFPVVLPTHTVYDAPEIDVLMVPGGIGAFSPLINDTVAYIRTVFPSLKYLVTICNGAHVAARAGVLDGRRATTNKQLFDIVSAATPAVDWVREARWVVDGNVWTTSGISAGIDGTLAWIECVFGPQAANNMSVYMEYNRELDPSVDPFANLSR